MQKDSLKGSMWQSCKDGLESQDIGGKKKISEVGIFRTEFA